MAEFGNDKRVGVGDRSLHTLIQVQITAVLALPVRFRTVLVAGSGNFSNLDEHVLVHTEAAIGVLVQAETGDDVILVALPVRFRTVLVAGSGNFSNLDEHVLVHTEAAIGVLVQAETGDDVILVGNGALVRAAGDLHVVRRVLLVIGEDGLLVARADERSAAYDRDDVILVGNGALVRAAGDLHVVRRVLLVIGEDGLLVARADERSAAYDHLAVLETLGTHEIENTTFGAI